MMNFLTMLWNKVYLYLIGLLSIIAVYFAITSNYNKGKAKRETTKRKVAVATSVLSEKRREVAQQATERDEQEIVDASRGKRNQMEKDW